MRNDRGRHAAGRPEGNPPGKRAGAAEYLADGVHDNGEITGTIDYVAGDADDDLLLAAATASGLYDAEFTANAANGTETFSCSGIFTSYGPDELPVRGKQTASFTFKVSGPLTQAAT